MAKSHVTERSREAVATKSVFVPELEEFNRQFVEELSSDLVWDEQRLNEELSRGRRVRAIRRF